MYLARLSHRFHHIVFVVLMPLLCLVLLATLAVGQQSMDSVQAGGVKTYQARPGNDIGNDVGGDTANKAIFSLNNEPAPAEIAPKGAAAKAGLASDQSDRDKPYPAEPKNNEPPRLDVTEPDPADLAPDEPYTNNPNYLGLSLSYPLLVIQEETGGQLMVFYHQSADYPQSYGGDPIFPDIALPDGGGVVPEGELVTVMAAPEPGYSLEKLAAHYPDGQEVRYIFAYPLADKPPEGAIQFVMPPAPVTITAMWLEATASGEQALHALRLTTRRGGKLAATYSDGTNSVPVNSSAVIPEGVLVTLTATPDSEHALASLAIYSLANDKTNYLLDYPDSDWVLRNPFSFIMPAAPVSVTATWVGPRPASAADIWPLELHPEPGGGSLSATYSLEGHTVSIDPRGDSVPAGARVRITASADTGYRVERLLAHYSAPHDHLYDHPYDQIDVAFQYLIDCSWQSLSPPLEFTMPPSPVTLTAMWEIEPKSIDMAPVTIPGYSAYRGAPVRACRDDPYSWERYEYKINNTF